MANLAESLFISSRIYDNMPNYREEAEQATWQEGGVKVPSVFNADAARLNDII